MSAKSEEQSKKQGENPTEGGERKPERGRKWENNIGSITTGIVLFVLTGGYLFLLFRQLRSPIIANTSSTEIINPSQFNEVILIMLAGGIGSLIYAIRAYLKHACERQDFKIAYIPWYVYWNIQGSLLGLIFYFALRGGLLLVTIGGESEMQTTINTWSILGIGALVGLFSKYAIDKLRQLFIMIFTSKADLDADEAEEKIISENRKLKLEIEKAK